MKAKKRHTAGERKKWTAWWRSSGLSGRAFADKHGLPAESIYRWGREFPATAGSGAKSGFAEVRVRGAEPEQARVEVVLGNGRVVRVVGEVEARKVRALVEALESC